MRPIPTQQEWAQVYFQGTATSYVRNARNAKTLAAVLGAKDLAHRWGATPEGVRLAIGQAIADPRADPSRADILRGLEIFH